MDKIWLKSYASSVPPEIDIEKINPPEALARTRKGSPTIRRSFFRAQRFLSKNLTKWCHVLPPH